MDQHVTRLSVFRLDRLVGIKINHGRNTWLISEDEGMKNFDYLKVQLKKYQNES